VWESVQAFQKGDTAAKQDAGGASREKMIGRTSNSAASDKGHTGALYSKNNDPAKGAGMVLLLFTLRPTPPAALFTTALDLYGGVLWSGELLRFVLHEMVHIEKI
jgi:hypothetical protein